MANTATMPFFTPFRLWDSSSTRLAMVAGSVETGASISETKPVKAALDPPAPSSSSEHTTIVRIGRLAFASQERRDWPVSAMLGVA